MLSMEGENVWLIWFHISVNYGNNGLGHDMYFYHVCRLGYGSWIYNYICNQHLSLLTLWVRIPLRRGVFDTTLCDKVCQWLVTGRWFSPGTPVSSTNKNDRHDITEILLKVALNTITLTLLLLCRLLSSHLKWYSHYKGSTT